MTNKEYRQANKKKYKKRIRIMWILWGVAMLGIFGFFIYLSFSDDLPSTEQLQDPDNNLASQVIASDGSVIGRYYVENRVKVDYDELPTNIVQALISTEDKRYKSHAGIDMEALARVVKGLATGTTSQGGGSTITQQLAKMQYSDRSFSGSKINKVLQLGLTKFKEWITAVQLEKRYTKEEILTMYLNQFDFLYGAVGIKSAAETYFGKTPKDLSVEESAILVGMLKNPARYNPKKFKENAKKRREVVLKLMSNQGHLTTTEYDSLRQLPIALHFSRKNHSEGIAPYFREELRGEVKKILKNIEEKSGKKFNVHTDGLKIYTTLNPRMQIHAEAAVAKNMKRHQKKFFKEWKGKDPWTYGQMTSKEKQMRLNAFDKVLRESDRYMEHRNAFLGDVLDVIQNSYDIHLQDYDIKRMLKEEVKKGHLSKLVSQNLLSKNKRKVYGKIMKDEAWTTLKRQWKKLNKKVKKDFDTPTKMKIFAYNDKMEVDTVMTPRDSLRYIRMQLQTGVMAINPNNGAIQAWVGGINHKYFKFDHVNTRVERQVGSTFKPFVYATYIGETGNSPCFPVSDRPYTIHKGEGAFNLIKDWTPKNFGEYTGESFSLYKGLEKSKNTVTAFLIKSLGSTQQVRELVERMGIEVDKKNVYGEPRVPKQPAIALGATDLSVFEMTGAYATFANEGVYQKPYFISKIEDRNGTEIYTHHREQKPPAMSEDVNYIMIDMLKRVTKPIQWRVKSPIAGKTGTTNKHADAWFMGFTPNIVIGTWVGGDDRWIRFRSPHLGQGGVLARPIFVDMLKGIENDTLIKNFDVNKPFKEPAGELSIRIDCDGIYGNPARGADDPANTGTTDDGSSYGDDIPEDDLDGVDGFDEPDEYNTPPSPKPNKPKPPQPNNHGLDHIDEGEDSFGDEIDDL